MMMPEPRLTPPEPTAMERRAEKIMHSLKEEQNEYWALQEERDDVVACLESLKYLPYKLREEIEEHYNDRIFNLGVSIQNTQNNLTEMGYSH